jgi:hypothetical protein
MDVNHPSPTTVRASGLWLCAVLNAILGVWLVILTILFALFFVNDQSQLFSLEHSYEDLNTELDPIIECCEANDPTNCTCYAPGTTVECWDASTNTPNITSGVPPSGDDLAILYIVCVAGNTTVDGHSDWELGDYIRWVEDNSTWSQNKAQGTGLPKDVIYFNWTCSSWVDPQPANMTVWELVPDWYMIYVTGVNTPTCINGSTPYCVPESPDLPAYLQMVNTTIEDRLQLGTVYDVGGLFYPFMRVELTTKFRLFSDFSDAGFPQCVFDPESSPSVALEWFEFVYSPVM